ncbi:DUF4142 domain-containing protein [Streptomyces sp. JJ66]|uniref:DUF4142 domain-containing protein n=1 Tax=Streptomyces sp. JJ66 TaxID=2803843 RepID=UPI001C589650|nr:DUF4142 domain-containing protein [Streptomyces sp. JJ66]MBW1602135.1 DUF4142 domain-containing protein [Streptomyces sp. JJ66]
MRPNRRAVRTAIPTRLGVVSVVAIVLIAVAVGVLALQNGSSRADVTSAPGSDPAAVPAGGLHDGSDAHQDAEGTQDAEAVGDIGTVTDVDRQFLVAVRQAGLWEIPAGRLAQTNASSEAVKRAGHHLIDGHAKLDQLVREDAKLLGVEIPDEATAEQQQWVEDLRAAKGAEFDKLFANVLRASHGKIFATIGEVRAATQNDLIRRHSRQANQTVLDHMEVLEDTGLVDPETFAEVEEAVSP